MHKRLQKGQSMHWMIYIPTSPEVLDVISILRKWDLTQQMHFENVGFISKQLGVSRWLFVTECATCYLLDLQIAKNNQIKKSMIAKSNYFFPLEYQRKVWANVFAFYPGKIVLFQFRSKAFDLVQISWPFLIVTIQLCKFSARDDSQKF